MSKTTEFNIKTPMCEFATGKPYANLNMDLREELNIKSEKDIKDNRDQIPDLTIADVLNQCFDLVSLASKTEFGTYNTFLIDIRNAKRDKKDFIEVDKSELELLKTIFEKSIKDKPELNRRAGFVIEVVDAALAEIAIKATKPLK